MLQVVERRVRRLTTLAPRWLLTIRDVHDIEQVVKCRRGRRKKDGTGTDGKAQSKQQLVFREMDVDELEGAIEA